jgi:hypothetical protein
MFKLLHSKEKQNKNHHNSETVDTTPISSQTTFENEIKTKPDKQK